MWIKDYSIQQDEEENPPQIITNYSCPSIWPPNCQQGSAVNHGISSHFHGINNNSFAIFCNRCQENAPFQAPGMFFFEGGYYPLHSVFLYIPYVYFYVEIKNRVRLQMMSPEQDDNGHILDVSSSFLYNPGKQRCIVHVYFCQWFAW